jgi:putative transposase
MARMPRIDIPGLPQHVIVRGNNRMPCFGCDMDYRVFLKYLGAALPDSDSRLHAFVLMTNHVHLLVTGQRGGAVSRLMQSVGRRYARYFNTAHDRSGTLFEGRFRASPIDSERYLLTCMRYIELNPVRAGIVRHPALYRWSSYRHHVGEETRAELTLHDEYLRLGPTPADLAIAYAAIVQESLSDEELARIRKCLNQNRGLGGPDFHQRTLGVRLTNLTP